MYLTYFRQGNFFFEKILSDKTKRKPSLSVITGDFNARSSSWWPTYIYTTEGSKLFSLTFSNGFHQLINELTHKQTSSSSCIDLIFIDQPNVSVNSGVHTSLHPYCHHQIVHSSFDLKAHGHDDISFRVIKFVINHF